VIFAVVAFASPVPNNIYIGLGSNLGDRAGNLLLAIRGLLLTGIEVVNLSQIYETEPFETIAQPAFLNTVVEVRSKTVMSPEELMTRLLDIETSLGRRREIDKGPRTIDLDLLVFGDQICESPLLKLPHPELHRRRFVLVPLAELAPALVHPVLQRSIRELLADLSDRSTVKLWPAPD
jgi:2-amino-4-hydroxy-6-hydroxymethyldihydropteridine diphosphokinase